MRPDAPPRVFIIAGPNGSGKSTLIRSLRSEPSVGFPEQYINADDIAARLRETSVATQEERERLAFRMARDLRVQYRETGTSHAFETVFSHPSTLLDIDRLRNLGFVTHLFFVTTERWEINLDRVARRVRQGGHDVPPDRIRDRYQRVMRLLPLMVERSDRAFLFDSSHSDQSTGEPTTRLVGEYERHIPVRLVETPPFLETALARPLQARSEERLVLAAGLSRDENQHLPDEAAGVYEGPIRAAGSHYILQDLGGGQVVRHDALLLTAPVSPGQNVRIAYKDGYGTPEPL